MSRAPQRDPIYVRVTIHLTAAEPLEFTGDWTIAENQNTLQITRYQKDRYVEAHRWPWHRIEYAHVEELPNIDLTPAGD